jgi:y4mF family transcriptional regulator
MVIPINKISRSGNFGLSILPKHANYPNGKFSLRPPPFWLIIYRTGNYNLIMTTIQTPQQLGDALRSARRQLGLTQPQIALAAGVGIRFIVDLEAGKPTMRLENVLRVIDALGGVIQLNGLPNATNESNEHAA